MIIFVQFYLVSTAQAVELPPFANILAVAENGWRIVGLQTLAKKGRCFLFLPWVGCIGLRSSAAVT